MWRLFAIISLLVLNACSLSSIIKQNSADYNEVIEYVTNDMLVTNMLRSRDEVPLHFSDLSQIHGVLQVGGSAQVSAPFGNPNIANQKTRDIFTGTLQASSSPTFDVAPLNNTLFATGLLRPLDLLVLQTYLDQGVPQGLLLKLLVSKIEFVNPGPPFAICAYDNAAFTNPVQTDPAAPSGPCPPAGLDPSIQGFGALVDRMTLPVIVHSYARLRPYGPPFIVDARNAVRNLSTAGASPLVLRPVNGHPGEFQFFKSSTETALCLPLLQQMGVGAAPGYVSTVDVPRAGCYASEIAQSDMPETSLHVRLYMRSMQGIFEYLGAVLRLEALNDQRATRGEAPLALPQYLNFYVRPGLDLGSRLNLTYNGDPYHVAASSGQDNTMRILQIVNQLLDTLKNASEIPSTKAVDVLP
jgi:hypothetical protein